MMADEIVIRRRALNSLAMYLADPLHVHESLDRGVIKVLGFRLKEEDYLVRERTTACLQLITRKVQKNVPFSSLFFANFHYETPASYWSEQDAHVCRVAEWARSHSPL